VNQEITNPHYIRERQTIKLPEITEDSWVIQAGDETYRIWVETFPDAKGVEALKKDPSLKGKNIDTLPRPVSSQETWYRAVTGDFKTREACLTAIHGLKLKGALVNL
jgi:hypothetical protein